MAAKLDGESDTVGVDHGLESGGVVVRKVDIGQGEDRGDENRRTGQDTGEENNVGSTHGAGDKGLGRRCFGGNLGILDALGLGIGIGERFNGRHDEKQTRV
jgi:hypothetical protein